MSEYSRIYSKGYSAGSFRKWPEHKPPKPPIHMIMKFLEAGDLLRNKADGICSQLTDDDDFVLELGPAIDDWDLASRNLTAWLKEIYSNENAQS